MTGTGHRGEWGGIEVEVSATVDSTCPMSCEMLTDQIQLIFGPMNHCARLYFDQAALYRLIAVVNAATRYARLHPERPPEFMISADEQSRAAHVPNFEHAGDSELLVSDVDNQTGRHHLI